MPRLAANLTMLFTEMPLPERFQAAAQAGFQGVEILYPYDIPPKLLTEYAKKERLEIVLINTPPPNWSGGERGFAAQKGREARFRTDFVRALRVAQNLPARHIHIMAGPAEGDEARRIFVENLKWAVRRAPHASLTIKPINRTDMPGYFLCDFDQAAAIITEIDAPNLGLQFDLYHAQMITGDALITWRKHQPLIRHIQIAGFPGRNEPNVGSLDYAGFLSELDAGDYRGWVGAEYNPLKLTEDGLNWLTHRADPPKQGGTRR